MLVMNKLKSSQQSLTRMITVGQSSGYRNKLLDIKITVINTQANKQANIGFQRYDLQCKTHENWRRRIHFFFYLTFTFAFMFQNWCLSSSGSKLTARLRAMTFKALMRQVGHTGPSCTILLPTTLKVVEMKLVSSAVCERCCSLVDIQCWFKLILRQPNDSIFHGILMM